MEEQQTEKLEKELTARLMERLDLTGQVEEAYLLSLIDEEIVSVHRTWPVPLELRIALRKRLFNSLRRLDVLQELLEDDSVTEIMVNGTEHIFVERGGCLYDSGKAFASEEKLGDVIQQIVARVNRTVNEANPIADARLEDGSRVSIVLKAAALNGPILTIRKFRKESFSLEQMTKSGTMTEEMAEYLKRCVLEKKNLFISGGTGSGKTTLLNALSEWIPETERVITIEDSAELQIRTIPNLVRLEARAASGEGEREISIRELMRTALRMRPDRLIVGEVRDGAALDMLQAMNTGHPGSFSTGHAKSAKDMLARLETMSLMGGDLPLAAIREQIGSAIDVLVHLTRTRDGGRRIETILEVDGYERSTETYLLKERFGGEN